MSRRSSHLGCLLAVLGLQVAPNGLAGQNVRPCARSQDLAIRSVSIMGAAGTGRALSVVDTLWVPAEGRFADEIYIRVELAPASATRAADSVYISGTMRLRLAADDQRGAAAPSWVEFPIRLVRDTIVSLGRNAVDLGPFSTRALVPWPGIAVQATANSFPTGVVAVASALWIHRAGATTCTEPLGNNLARSRVVPTEFAH